MKKFYPFDPRNNQNYNVGPALRYANTSYEGDSVSIYNSPLKTSIYSEEDIHLTLNKYNPFNSQIPILAQYTETRQSPILPYKSNSYKVCVAGCILPETSIYLFEWEDTVTLPDNTQYAKYTVTVEYSDGSGLPPAVQTESLEFFPYYTQDTQANGRRRVYSIDQVLQSINQAFSVAIIALKASAGLNADYKSPYFYMERNSSLISFLFDFSQQGATNLTIENPLNYLNTEIYIRISFNFNVHQWFADTFPSIIPDIGEISNLPYAYLKTFLRREPNYQVTVDATPYWRITQMNSSTDLFSTVEKIIIVSNINTRPTYSSILGLSSLNNVNANPSSMSSINVLAQFPYTLSSFNNEEISKPLILQPPFHTWLDIITEQPIRELSYQILVLRTTGIVSEVTLMPGQVCSLNLIFSLK